MVVKRAMTSSVGNRLLRDDKVQDSERRETTMSNESRRLPTHLELPSPTSESVSLGPPAADPWYPYLGLTSPIM
jgi:hypothetical protein